MEITEKNGKLTITMDKKEAKGFYWASRSRNPEESAWALAMADQDVYNAVTCAISEFGEKK